MRPTWQIHMQRRLVAFWHLLTEPHPALTDESQRAQARMLAAIHLPMPGLLLLFFLSRTYGYSTFATNAGGFTLVACVAIVVSYALSRTRYYRLGVYAVIAAVIALIAASMLLDRSRQAFSIMPLYLAHAVLLSSLFLSVRTTVSIAVLTFVALLVFGLTLPEALRENIANDLRYLSTVYILLVVSTIVRAYHERQIFRNALTVRESEARYRMLFEETFEPLLIHDKGYVVAMNPAMERVSGYTNAEIKGHSLVNFIHTDSRELFAVGAIAGAKGLEVKLLRKDGQPVAAQIFTKPITYYGREMRMVSVRDLTSQHVAEAARLEIALAQDRQLVLQKLIRNLSHDFRTPLAVIKTSLYMLERSTTDHQRHQKHLDIVRLQTNRLQEMMDDFIALARLDYARKSDLTVEEVNLDHVLRDVVADHQGLASKRKITLEYHGCADAEKRYIDKEALQRITKSLVSNGLLYTLPGGRVDVRARIENSAVHLRVEDTGVGIHPDEIDRIFEPFFRGDPTRSTETGGAGLGLTIARKHIEVLGGTIEVESQLGVGSIFQVILPLSQPVLEDDIDNEPLPESLPPR